MYTWEISVSNDGQSYGNQLQFSVYDSKCLDCECEGRCQIKVSNLHFKFYNNWMLLTFALKLLSYNS